jgi:hypothetical protein
VLELRGSAWVPDAIISSSTLTHLDLDAWPLARLPTRIWDGLPNLLHLRIRADYADISPPPFDSPFWASLPSLRSLSINHRRMGSQFACLTHLLRCAPQLVALQLTEADTLEAIEFYRAHRDDELGGGIRRKPLQLLCLITTHQQVQGRWGDLLTIAPILRGWDPDEGTEWHLEKCVSPIVIDGVKIRLCAYGIELSPPLSVRADEIAGEGVQSLSRTKLNANG